MGLMSKILGGRQERNLGDYAEIQIDESTSDEAAASMHVHIAEVAEKQDALEIKDAIYDGDMVVADITRLRTEDQTTEHIVEDLRRVAEEVDGDIVKKGTDQLIVAPTGVRISREKLGSK